MTDWIEANQQRLTLALAAVAEALNAKLPPEARVESAPRAEVADTGGLSKDDVKALVAACRKSNVRLIPGMNLLGHQSWKSRYPTPPQPYPSRFPNCLALTIWCRPMAHWSYPNPGQRRAAASQRKISP